MTLRLRCNLVAGDFVLFEVRGEATRYCVADGGSVDSKVFCVYETLPNGACWS